MKDSLRIVGNSLNYAHRGVIVRNHCIRENIIYVENESEIDEKTTNDELFCYKINENKYVVVRTEKIYDGYVFYGYVLRHIEEHLDIVKYDEETFTLSSLKLQDKKKLIELP